MFYLLLIVLFILVFAFLLWRILTVSRPEPPAPIETYVCPVCGHDECECHRIDGEP
jgi:hypothetical protein